MNLKTLFAAFDRGLKRASLWFANSVMHNLKGIEIEEISKGYVDMGQK